MAPLQLLKSKYSGDQPFELVPVNQEREPDSLIDRLWNNEFKAVLDHINDGVLLIDLVDRVRIVNKNALKLMGLTATPDNLSEMPVSLLMRTSKIDLEDLIGRARISHKNHFKEIVFLNKRSTVCEVEIKTLYQRSSVPVGTLCILRDISKQWTEDHKKSEFLSIVAHELFNPLTPVKEGLGLLLEEGIGTLNPEQKKCAGVVYEEVNRLSRLVSDLLDINRLDAGKIRIQRSVIDIHSLITSAITSVGNKASEKNIAVFENIPHPVFDLYADRDRMKQVLINLLDNAVKYSPPGGSVEIGALSKSGGIEITVTDRGFGILKQDIKRLFERFVQLNYPEHMEHREKGSGLGLSIVKEIVKLHHGKIKVRSEYGHGSTFTVTLPKRKKARHHETL
jgi:two-component system phosphate regulon sensor histidine kinase PhoR